MASLFIALALGTTLALGGCKPRATDGGSDVLGSVPLKTDAPPAISYHFGQYRYLRGYGDRNGSLTDQEWISIPSATKYSGFRRGFYVGQHPAYNERYALEYLTETRDLAPWIAEVHLKSECVASSGQRRFVLDLRQITTDPDFVAWINSVGSNWSLDAFRGACPIEDFMIQDKETTCHQLMNAYYREKNIGVVYDHFWPGTGFWLVRDNQCIEQVLASPKSVLEMFARERDLWREKPYDTDAPRDTQGKGKPTHALFHVLVRALHEAVPNEEVLAEIERKAQESDYPVTTDAVTQLARVARHCVKQGQYDRFRGQTEFFLSKAEIYGYLNSDPKKATGESVSYDTHMRRLVSFGLPKSCDGADAVVKGQVVAPKAAKAEPGESPVAAVAPTPEPQVICNVTETYCAPGKKAFLSALRSSGFSLDQLNLVRVYVDSQADTAEDGFSSNLKIRYDSSASDVATVLNRRKQVVDITREFQKLHANLSISCAIGGNYCLAPANRIRKILNENERFNAESLRVTAIDVDAQPGFYATNHIDVRYDMDATEIIRILDSRLSFLKASDQVSASLKGVKVDCTISGNYCPQVVWKLGETLGKNGAYTTKSLRLDRLSIGSQAAYLDPTTMALRYDMSGSEIAEQFSQRLSFLKYWDAHLALFPNARLDCELSGAYCQQTGLRIYQASASSKDYDEKKLKVNRIVISGQGSYREKDRINVRYDSSTSEIRDQYAQRVRFVDQRDAFQARFPGLSVTCEISESYCQNAMERLYAASASVPENLGLSAVRISARGDDGKGSTLVIRYDASASEIASQLRARAK